MPDAGDTGDIHVHSKSARGAHEPDFALGVLEAGDGVLVGGVLLKGVVNCVEAQGKVVLVQKPVDFDVRFPEVFETLEEYQGPGHDPAARFELQQQLTQGEVGLLRPLFGHLDVGANRVLFEVRVTLPQEVLFQELGDGGGAGGGEGHHGSIS